MSERKTAKTPEDQTGGADPSAAAPAGHHPLDRDMDGHPGGSMEQLVTYLTTRASDEFGAFGRFVDLKPAAARKHVDSGLLTLPTAEQLAMRRY